ncbi:Peptide-methionine (S)-S-oxide reductase [Aphelenchoides fujianensis]|nr:Peptide-methionine (S)-S-oxide reductase [Aphelenchoides fujianensis]
MLKKAYFGMQCFWGESAFGKIDGVLNTRVGYAGGTTKNPTYTSIGDHTEVTELSFDESVVGYKELVHFFFDHHDSTVPHKAQYRSLILWTDEEQKKVAEAILEDIKKQQKNVQTKVEKLDVFYEAEGYHQKYWLQSQKRIVKELGLKESELATSQLATKLNAFLAGYDRFDVLKDLAKKHNLSDSPRRSRDEHRAGGRRSPGVPLSLPTTHFNTRVFIPLVHTTLSIGR